jgi:hypothetical protein
MEVNACLRFSPEALSLPLLKVPPFTLPEHRFLLHRMRESFLIHRLQAYSTMFL